MTTVVFVLAILSASVFQESSCVFLKVSKAAPDQKSPIEKGVDAVKQVAAGLVPFGKTEFKAELKAAGETEDLGSKKKEENADDSDNDEEDLAAMKKELEELRKRINANAKKDKSDDQTLKALQKQLEEMQEAEKKEDKVDAKRKKEMKAEIQRLRERIEKLMGGDGEASEAVRIGGHLQTSYTPAFKLYADWANGDAAARDVVTSFKMYDPATMAADVAKMTTAGDASYVDVLVCPYGSANVIKCVQAVNKAYAGPVIAWGGASDKIFTTECPKLANNNCFGFFSVGCDYMKTGLIAAGGKISAKGGRANVAVITNTNDFSASVATGAKETIAEQSSSLTLQSETTISVAKKPLTDADKAKIKAAMDKKPDIVVIAGHNKDVEPTIIAIGKSVGSGNSPHAIIATNGISATGNYGSDSKFAQCVMMPTQWDSSTKTQDAVIGWSSDAFKTAMGGSATYQQASAGAVGVALANALKAQPDATKLVATMKAMDVDSFYGKLKWDANGRIQKPMYTQQLQTADKTIVAPTGMADMKFPLGVKSCWNFGDASKEDSK